MHNYWNKPNSDLQVASNWATTKKGMEASAYFPFLVGTDFTPDPALPGSVNNALYPYSFHEYDDAADERAFIVLRRHERQLNGTLRVRHIFYAGSAANNNFLLQIELNTFRDGSAFGASISNSTVFVTAAAPSAANTLKKLDVTASAILVPMNVGVDITTVGVRRLGANVADTNNGTFNLIGVQMEYVEKQIDYGEAVDKLIY